MNNFNEIKGLWQTQSVAGMPDIESVKKAAAKTRRQLMIKNLAVLASLGGTVIFSAYIGLACHFQFLTTRLGILLVIIGIIGAMVLNSQMLKLILNKADNTMASRAYLQQLIEYRNKQRFFQTTGMVIYYILLTSGFSLYLYEFFVRNHVFGLKAYAVTLGWIAFSWFYLKPKAIRKQEKRINNLIEQIESISKQMQ